MNLALLFVVFLFFSPKANAPAPERTRYLLSPILFPSPEPETD